MEDNTKDKLRLQLDNILTSNMPNEIKSEVNPIDILNKKAVKSHNYSEIKKRVTFKAKKMINSLMRFYLSEEIINNEEYIQLRAEYEKMTLSALLYQLKTAELAITTLLETIDRGDLSARMFEVLGSLQKSILDIIKTQTMSLIAAEDTFKKISHDIDVYRSNTEYSTNNSNNAISSRGTKDIMRAIKNINKNDDIDNIESEEI